MEKLLIINKAQDELVVTVEKLERLTAELSNALNNANVIACKFITLPSLTMEEEKHRLLNGPPRFIKVINGELNAGLAHGSTLYGAFTTEFGMSTRYSRNYPGIICIQDAPEKLVELIEYINNLKLYFSAVLKNLNGQLKPYYSNADSLKQVIFDVIHQRLPMLLTESVSRKIQLVDKPVAAAYFSMRANIKKNEIDRDKLIRRLSDQLEVATDNGDKALCNVIYEEMAVIRGSAYSVFGYPKVTSPTPTLTLKFREEVKPANFRACLPVIVINQGCDAPEIADMANYDAEQREKRKKRENAAQAVCIFPRTGLHGYE